MKKIFSALYTALCHFSLAFSGIIIFFWLCFPTQTGGYRIDHIGLTAFFRFALIYGISSVIFALPKSFPYAIKVLLHLIVNVIAFLLTIVTVYGINQKTVFIYSTIFIIVYAFIFSIVKLIGLMVKRIEK